jgi:WD40 repeat protein
MRSDRGSPSRNLAAGRQVLRRGGQPGESRGPAHSMAFSPDGRYLVAGSEVGRAIIGDATDSREVHQVPGDENAAEWITFSADGRRLVSGSRDQILNV